MDQQDCKQPVEEEETGTTSMTPSSALLFRILGKSPSPRMLTRYEVELLRQSENEIALVTREVLSGQWKTEE